MDDQPYHPLLIAYLERREDLRRYFTARLRSRAAAEDLVQDIYLKVLGAAPEEVRDPGAFLFRLGSNLMLDKLKHQQRSMRRDEAWRRHKAENDDPHAVSKVEEALAARQRLHRIIEAIEELPAPVQAAFRLHKLEGRGHAETAELLGVSRSSVEKYIMRALRHVLERVAR